ncbi:ABC transporter ATP-binding protein [Haloarcula salina]|uniref:ABC transporter ATP-binding protein n=1 Tax=Haloarcula salina TaxID=1429914 RepID=UPI003C6FED8E
MLRTQGLTKEFGGLTAVDDVDFELDHELCSLIGPNGAGKTTFFNLLTGALTPTAGTVELRRGSDWEDITDAEPHETASRGLHRSYQVTNVFPNSTVLENVRVAEQAHSGEATTFWRNVDHYDEFAERAREILDRVGLTERADDHASTLSHGAKRKLEVAIALAGDPAVLLLDEPNAGVSSESVDEIRDLIESVAEDYPVLLVEHNMDIVMGVSDRVVVLHQGAVIADGPPDEVRANPDVQSAYLGGYEPGSLSEGTDAESGADSEGGIV